MAGCRSKPDSLHRLCVPHTAYRRSLRSPTELLAALFTRAHHPSRVGSANFGMIVKMVGFASCRRQPAAKPEAFLAGRSDGVSDQAREFLQLLGSQCPRSIRGWRPVPQFLAEAVPRRAGARPMASLSMPCGAQPSSRTGVTISHRNHPHPERNL